MKKFSPRKHSPPWLAKMIIRYLAPISIREELLGDLQEEFVEKLELNDTYAKRWYWKQSLGSVIPLVKQRLSSTEFKTFIWVLFVIILSLLILYIWERHIARRWVVSLAGSQNPPSMTLLRWLYFLLLSVGGFVVGFFCSLLNQKSNISAKQNMMRGVIPVSVFVVLIILLTIKTPISDDMFEYILKRLFFMVSSLITGSLIYQLFKR